MSYFNFLDQKNIFTYDFNEDAYLQFYFEHIMKCKDDELNEKVTFTIFEEHTKLSELENSKNQLNEAVVFNESKMEDHKVQTLYYKDSFPLPDDTYDVRFLCYPE